MTGRSTRRAQMGTSMVTVNNASGWHDEPRAQTLCPPSAGHKIPRGQAARRSAVEIDANSGRAMDTDLTRRLQAIAAGNPHDPATYERFKHRAQADAVNAWTAGYAPAAPFDVRLGRPSADVLRHIFGVPK